MSVKQQNIKNTHATFLMILDFDPGNIEIDEKSYKNIYYIQGGTSSVTFVVLIMNCEKVFVNLLIFNYLASNINWFIFNCLTLNINLFIFNCYMPNFCFPKNIPFGSRRERLFLDLLSSGHK